MAEPDSTSSAAPALETPVALLVFNRPDYTARVFDRIREARPQLLLVVADGPRVDVPADRERCAEVRRLIEAGVDWPCELRMNASDINLGCRERIVSGLRWVFAQCESAIILEDDCLPDPSFFGFCETLLARYANDPRVGMIAGTNYMEDKVRCSASYFASHHVSIWGWATWRRAFADYDPEMTGWRIHLQPDTFFSKEDTASFRRLHTTMFDLMREARLPTWDIPWVFTLRRTRSCALVPARNLISNIGIEGVRGRGGDRNNQLRTSNADQPLTHPTDLKPIAAYERHVTRRHRIVRDWMRALWSHRIRRLFRHSGTGGVR